MLKKLSLIALTLILTTSCVSKKIYTDLEDKYAELKKENRKLSDNNQELETALNKAKNDIANLQKDYEDTLAQRNKLQADYDATKTNLDNVRNCREAIK